MNLVPTLLLSLFFLGVVSAQLTWSGTWDTTCNSTVSNSRNCYGGYLSLCTDGTRIFGTYSNLGEINGTTNGRTATGTWREAGYTDNVSGGFFWQLNSDTENVKFTGYYWLDSHPCTNYTWNGRLFDPQVDESKCLTVESDTVPSIAGHWQSGVLNAGIDDLYICIQDKSTFTASSNIKPQGYQTFSYGRVHIDEGKVGQGSAYYNFGNNFYNAITYMVLTGENTLVTLNYRVDSVADADLSYDVTPKDQITWTRIGTASEASCTEYRNLAKISWEGAWTDSRNGDGRFYTCLVSTDDGTAVSGVYSEYGYVSGLVTEDGYTLVGNFYESGADGRTGEFNITIAADGHSFSGYYAYTDSLSEQHTWSEQRVDVSNDQIQNCWLESTSQGNDADGSWIVDFYGNFLDLCIDGNSFVASYEFGNESTPGYIEGNTLDGKSLQATFYEETLINLGIIRYTNDGLQLSIWDQPIASPYFEPCNGREKNAAFGHQRGVLQRSIYAKEDCSRNEYLKTGDIPKSSNANLIVPSIFVVLVFCLISLF